MNDNIAIYDHITGENIIRQATDEEQKIINEEREINTKAREKRLLEIEAKAQAKATAEGKLAALGLTTDDLRALGL